MPEPTSSLADRDLVLDLTPPARARLDRRVVLGALAAGASLWIAIGLHLAAAARPRYATEPAHLGDLVVRVTATGTLQPLEQVDIGSELSGTLRSVEVGYNDPVRASQVLARLDDARLSAQVLQSRAALDAARAAVDESRANLAEAESQLARLQHVREISGGKVPSQQELAAAQATRARAQGAQASAEAQVAQAQATLDVQQTDLGKAVIRSPIDGVVLTATARPGQTVAASLQAPVLFTLARDLTQLELSLSIDEADVGRVREGQTATFAVDAWPGRTFPGRVRQVRFAAHTVAGVVSYEAILSVENPELLLRPGMTATAEVEVQRDEQVLLVPNAALRFEPEGRTRAGAGGIAALVAKRSFDVSRSAEPAQAPRVWALRHGILEPLEVEPGASDGVSTEIAMGTVPEGTPLVVSATTRRG